MIETETSLVHTREKLYRRRSRQLIKYVAEGELKNHENYNR